MKKKFLGIICLLYSFLVTYIWLFDKMKNFLAPQMQLYLKLSLFPLILISFVLLFNNKIHYKFKISDIILLLPIVLFFTAGDGRLTASFASNRMSSLNANRTVKTETNEEKIKEEPILDEHKEEKQDIIEETNNDEKPIYFEVEDANYNELAYYLTYSPKSVKYENETIRVRGFSVTDSPYLLDGYFALGKYAISCCVADAGFTGFVVKYDLSQIKNNTWYEVEGVLKKGKDIEDYDIMYIEVSNIKEIDGTSEEQYVYPCYTYDNGLCKAVTKYNLEH